MRRIPYLLFALLLAASMVLAACGASPMAENEAQEAITEATPEDAVAEDEVSPDDVSEELAPGAENMEDRVPIRWFVGLGTGHQEELQPTQLEIVQQFNESQDRIALSVQFVDTDVATDILNTQIAAGNAPDIVGPVGIQGRGRFEGAWLDLTDLIESDTYDLSDFDPALVDFYRVEGEGQVGIPFAIFPSFIYFNQELFDEAGLEYPPQEFGATYNLDGEEREWNLETLRDLALLLTVDENGNDATSPDFDPDAIVQFGFNQQFTDMRGRATLWGAGNFVDDEGNAVIPDQWREAMNWIHTAAWEDYFYPNGPYADSVLLNEGDSFASGNTAMDYVHLWYASCCLAEFQPAWDVAVAPSVNGQITAKMHADTFSIMRFTDHPEEAFEVLSYLLSPEVADTLTQLYGGMPARISLQDEYFDKIDTQFPNQDVNWDVVQLSTQYPDNPSHEASMPNFLESQARYDEFLQLLLNEPDIDVDAELDTLRQDLQTIFDTE